MLAADPAHACEHTMRAQHHAGSERVRMLMRTPPPHACGSIRRRRAPSPPLAPKTRRRRRDDVPLRAAVARMTACALSRCLCGAPLPAAGELTACLSLFGRLLSRQPRHSSRARRATRQSPPRPVSSRVRGASAAAGYSPRWPESGCAIDTCRPPGRINGPPDFVSVLCKVRAPSGPWPDPMAARTAFELIGQRAGKPNSPGVLAATRESQRHRSIPG